jgi:hypothetical protein
MAREGKGRDVDALDHPDVDALDHPDSIKDWWLDFIFVGNRRQEHRVRRGDQEQGEAKGSFETIHVEDALGHQFPTRLANVFTIGKDRRSWVSLPKSKGVKLTIIQEARKHNALAASEA